MIKIVLLVVAVTGICNFLTNVIFTFYIRRVKKLCSWYTFTDICNFSQKFVILQESIIVTFFLSGNQEGLNLNSVTLQKYITFQRNLQFSHLYQNRRSRRYLIKILNESVIYTFCTRKTEYEGVN